jgi:Na+/H+ antiporter NhaD/arsenite permease-like protein
VPFAISAGVLTGMAVGSGRVAARRLVQSVAIGGLAVVVIAAIASGSMASGADVLPRPDAGATGLILAMVVGSVLALVANNLPAAAFGAVWLARAHPATIIAFLIGTNVAAIATPHGSVATMLARATGARHGVLVPVGTYLRSAWRYAAVGSAAALAALILVSR